MLINRLRSALEFKNISFPEGYLDDIGKAPGDVLIIFRKLIESYLNEINLPENEIHDLTDQIEGGKMNRLFEHFEGFDIQAVRKESRMEGHEEGREELLIEKVCKKLKKGMAVDRIAAELEEDEPRIQAIVNVAQKYAPDYDTAKILKDVLSPADEQ